MIEIGHYLDKYLMDLIERNFSKTLMDTAWIALDDHTVHLLQKQ